MTARQTYRHTGVFTLISVSAEPLVRPSTDFPAARFLKSVRTTGTTAAGRDRVPIHPHYNPRPAVQLDYAPSPFYYIHIVATIVLNMPNT